MNNTEISVLMRYAESLFVDPSYDEEEQQRLLIEGRSPAWFLSPFCNNFPPNQQQKTIVDDSNPSPAFLAVEDPAESEGISFFSKIRQERNNNNSKNSNNGINAQQQQRQNTEVGSTSLPAAGAQGSSGTQTSFLVGASPSPADALQELFQEPSSAIESIKKSFVSFFESLSKSTVDDNSNNRVAEEQPQPALRTASGFVSEGAVSRVPTGLQPYPSKLAFGGGGGGGSFVGSHYSGGGLTDSSFAFTNNHSLALSHTASGARVYRAFSNFNGRESSSPFETALSSAQWWTTAVASSHSFASLVPQTAGGSQQGSFARRPRTRGFCVAQRPFAAPSVSPLIAWYNQEAHVFIGDAQRVQDCLQRVWGLLCLDGGKEEKLPNAKTIRWILGVLSDRRARGDVDLEHQWSDLTLKELKAGSRTNYLHTNRPRANKSVFEHEGNSADVAQGCAKADENRTQKPSGADIKVQPSLSNVSKMPSSGAGPTMRVLVPTLEELSLPDEFEAVVRPFCIRTIQKTRNARDFSEMTRNDSLAGAIVLFTRFLQKQAEIIGRDFLHVLNCPQAGNSVDIEDRLLPNPDFTWLLSEKYLPPSLCGLRRNRFNFDLAIEACLQLVKAQYDSLRPPSASHGRTPQPQEEISYRHLLSIYRGHILAALDYDIVVVAPQVYLEPLEWSVAACPPQKVPKPYVVREKKLAKLFSAGSNSGGVGGHTLAIESETALDITPRDGAPLEAAADESCTRVTKPSASLSSPSMSYRPASVSASEGACSSLSTRTLSQATRTQSWNHASCATSSRSLVAHATSQQCTVSAPSCSQLQASVTVKCDGSSVMVDGKATSTCPSPSSSALVAPTISGLRRHDHSYHRQQQTVSGTDLVLSPDAVQLTDDRGLQLMAAAMSTMPPTVPEDESWNCMRGYPLTKEEVYELYGYASDEDVHDIGEGAMSEEHRHLPAFALGEASGAVRRPLPRERAARPTPFAHFRKESNMTIDILVQHSACLAACQHISWVAGSALLATVFRLFPSLFTPSVVEAYLHNLERRYGEHVARAVNVAHTISTIVYEGRGAERETGQQSRR